MYIINNGKVEVRCKDVRIFLILSACSLASIWQKTNVENKIVCYIIVLIMHKKV